MVNLVNPTPPSNAGAVVDTCGLAFFIACLLGGCAKHRRHRRGPAGGRRRFVHGKRIAILVDRGFEQPELLQPRQALIDAGATTVLIAPEPGSVRATRDTSDWGVTVTVDLTARPGQGLRISTPWLLPGGVMSPDRLRINPQAVALVREVRRRRKAGRRHLPRPADVDRGRRG